MLQLALIKAKLGEAGGSPQAQYVAHPATQSQHRPLASVKNDTPAQTKQLETLS